MWASPSSNYMLAYSREAVGAVLKEADARTGNKESLVEAALPATDRVNLVFEVRGGGSRPTRLTGWVNGKELLATDADGFDSFAGVGLWVGGDQAPVDVLWDDLKVTRL